MLQPDRCPHRRHNIVQVSATAHQTATEMQQKGKRITENVKHQVTRKAAIQLTLRVHRLPRIQQAVCFAVG